MPVVSQSSAPDIADPVYRWGSFAIHADQPEPIVCRWLENESSLTRQLIDLSNNQFRVELVDEGWVTLPSPALSVYFGPVAPQHRFWSRKVRLWGEGRVWVAAHTLIPAHSFCSPLRQVMELQTRPRGEFLFSHPDLLRGEMEFTPGRYSDWGRRRVFFLYAKPVMVAEFFLPELIRKIMTAG